MELLERSNRSNWVRPQNTRGKLDSWFDARCTSLQWLSNILCSEDPRNGIAVTSRLSDCERLQEWPVVASPGAQNPGFWEKGNLVMLVMLVMW